MSKVEEYIRSYTRNCSNELDAEYVEDAVYFSWLTPDNARSVALIAKEEIIEKAVEWLHSNLGSRSWMAEFRKAMEEVEV